MKSVLVIMALLAQQVSAANTVSAPKPGADTVFAWLAPKSTTMQWRALASPSEVKPSEQFTQVPLGSLWKLFVFIYLQQNAVQEPMYACTKQGQQRDDEEYCCDAGQSVGRELALARSCGLYFAPERLKLSSAHWQQFWRSQLTDAPAWLLNLPQLRADSSVPLASLLQVMAGISPSARDGARNALLTNSLHGRLQANLPALGTLARMKTFTWQHPRKAKTYFGGAAGWLPNGTVFWLGGTGSSRSVLNSVQAPLAATLQELAVDADQLLAASSLDEPCVEVEFFARYPLRRVLQADNTPAPVGKLRGRYVLEFENGKQLPVQSNGALQLQQIRTSGAGQWRISARLALNDYVARVVEREGDANEVAAARALALAARSYLLQNGQLRGSCYLIKDDSRTQRVSPNTPQAASLAASWFSDGLILGNSAVRYHQSEAKPGVMAWTQAVAQAKQGWQFDQILAHAYPQASLRGMQQSDDCQRLPASQAWLEKAAQRWQKILRSEAGFETPTAAPLVCMLEMGNPYSDQRRMRLYVRSNLGREERISLAHEYLHLAFRFHPRGVDEQFLEQWARKLVDVL